VGTLRHPWETLCSTCQDTSRLCPRRSNSSSCFGEEKKNENHPALFWFCTIAKQNPEGGTCLVYQQPCQRITVLLPESLRLPPWYRTVLSEGQTTALLPMGSQVEVQRPWWWAEMMMMMIGFNVAPGALCFEPMLQSLRWALLVAPFFFYRRESGAYGSTMCWRWDPNPRVQHIHEGGEECQWFRAKHWIEHKGTE
jgi:hypothetical protein